MTGKPLPHPEFANEACLNLPRFRLVKRTVRENSLSIIQLNCSHFPTTRQVVH